jgi:hypothetical protein
MSTSHSRHDSSGSALLSIHSQSQSSGASPSVHSDALNFHSDALTPKLGSRKASAQSQPTPTKNLQKQSVGRTHAVQQKHKSLLVSRPLPKQRHPSKCPLFCCFYAEFDNKLGPKICYQSPKGFMDQEIKLGVDRVHEILAETFETLRKQQQQAAPFKPPTEPSSTEPTQQPTASTTTANEEKESIFDSCSEFIITGNELTGNIVNLSTHRIHVLSRPTVISNERYERNSLLFCVGFVLCRTQDPSPFRPVLNKWALALRDLELESQYLSGTKTRHMLQQHLERILVSLNSPTWECNLLLNRENVLNLKLFHPPKSPAPLVNEYSVPVLLRRDHHLHLYDWDLSINWVSLHIDGVTNARQISKMAQVDMEMVLSCLRVLRHHGT